MCRNSMRASNDGQTIAVWQYLGISASSPNELYHAKYILKMIKHLSYCKNHIK